MNNKYLQVEGHPELVKDKTSGAVLNIDNAALESYKKQKAEKIQNNKRMNKLEDNVNNLTNLVAVLIEEIRKSK